MTHSLVTPFELNFNGALVGHRRLHGDDMSRQSVRGVVDSPTLQVPNTVPTAVTKAHLWLKRKGESWPLSNRQGCVAILPPDDTGDGSALRKVGEGSRLVRFERNGKPTRNCLEREPFRTGDLFGWRGEKE